MSTSNTAIKPSSGVIALLTMLTLVVFGYAYYLTEAGRGLDYQAAALGPAWYMFKPVTVLKWISEGGYPGTLAAVAINLLHAMFYAAMVFCIGNLGFSRFYAPRNRASDPQDQEVLDPAVSGLFACEIEGSTIMVSIPAGKDPKTGATIEGVYDTDPFNQTFLRCDRVAVQTARIPETPIEKLQIALYEILRAHPGVPASVGHHHADASLMDHSIAISKVVSAYMRDKGWTEPLARVAGLAHDLDKLLAYQEKGQGVWVKRKDATHHNTYSAYLVAQQPEFKLLPTDDQFTLTMALRYYHHPQMLPKNAGVRCERLLQAIRHADGTVIKTETDGGIEAAKKAPNTTDLVAEAIDRFLQEADINGYMGGHLPAGWTKDALSFVVVPMSKLIETLGQYLPVELSRQLQLNVDSRNYGHQAIPVIQDALKKLDLLLLEHKEKVSKTGLFDVMVGVKKWQACVLLDKEKIAEMIPTIFPKWGMTAFAIKRINPTVDKADSEDDEDDQ